MYSWEEVKVLLQTTEEKRAKQNTRNVGKKWQRKKKRRTFANTQRKKCQVQMTHIHNRKEEVPASIFYWRKTVEWAKITCGRLQMVPFKLFISILLCLIQRAKMIGKFHTSQFNTHTMPCLLSGKTHATQIACLFLHQNLMNRLVNESEYTAWAPGKWIIHSIHIVR